MLFETGCGQVTPSKPTPFRNGGHPGSPRWAWDESRGFSTHTEAGSCWQQELLYNQYYLLRIVMMNEISLDPESHQIREVFANYGLALYLAQCVEKQIAILLAGAYAPTPGKMTKFRFDDLLDSGMEKMFGKLVGELENKVTIAQEIKDKLDLAVKNRNWLAHYYWWDRVSEFNSDKGRESMLKELREINILFEELEDYLADLLKRWAKETGMTLEDFASEVESLLSGPTPPREKQRRLQKSETLIRVYKYKPDSDDNVEAPIFELSDNTFWTLCDCGLLYHPGKIDNNYLTPDERFSNKLPATITPRPKDADKWNYTISLSTGYYIKVSPYEGHGKFAYKWGLFPSRDKKLI